MYITYNLIKRILYGFHENYDLVMKTDQNAAIPLIIYNKRYINMESYKKNV